MSSRWRRKVAEQAVVRVCLNGGSVLRRIALGAVVAVLTPALVASAGTQGRSCYLVRDASGDAQDLPRYLVNGPNQPNVDITSVDVASDSRYVTTVLRVQSLGTALQAAPGGASYFVYFRLGDTHYLTAANRFVDGTSFSLSGGRAPEGASGPVLPLGATGWAVTGVFDEVRNEVRVHVPLQLLRKDGSVARGRLVTHIAAATYVTVGSYSVVGTHAGTQADGTEAPPGRYPLGAPSCVSPGR